MRLHEPIAQKRRISLTPLIDVVFLLLVFFMLASTFLQFGTMKLDTATAAGGVADPKKLVLVHVDSDQRYRVNGVSTAADSLISALNNLVENGARDAALVVRPGAKVDDLVQAVRLVRQSRIKSVKIVE